VVAAISLNFYRIVQYPRSFFAIFSVANSKYKISVCMAFCAACLLAVPVHAKKTRALDTAATAATATTLAQDGVAEARLIEVYKLIAAGNNRAALDKSDQLVAKYPNFQLAQLVHGDLLASRTRGVNRVGDVPDTTARLGAGPLADLREESRLRLAALRERPVPATLPSQFVTLSARNKHAIAVDASRARLYLFENTPQGAKLIADYYVSVGKAGVEKTAEGDLRTPLGVYFLTGNLDKKNLRDLYGAGALPLNYPNPLDTARGKTGSGIWLHGTPREQFTRAPKATDGCVAIANPDLERILSTVEVRTTPIVIATQLQWVSPAALSAERNAFASTLQAWKSAKESGQISNLLPFYAPTFNSYGKTLRDWQGFLEADMRSLGGTKIELRDLSSLSWRDASTDAMVVTFAEIGATKGAIKPSARMMRQYWTRTNNQWKLFFEGVIQ
jgi:L,D-transpeptidase YnhG